MILVQLDQLRSGPVDRMSINGGSTLLQYVLVLVSHPKQIQCVCSRAFFDPNQIRVKQDNPELSFRGALPTWTINTSDQKNAFDIFLIIIQTTVKINRKTWLILATGFPFPPHKVEVKDTITRQ